MKISICSGGTGGHMFPACALFEKLKQRGHIVSMITDTRGERFCTDSITEKTVIGTIRFNPQDMLGVFKSSYKVAKRFLQLWWNEKPDVIIGFGGLFTAIPIFVGKILGAKIIIYEQNSIIGKANKLLSYLADYKLSNFAISYKWYRIASPVRQEFIDMAETEYKCPDDNDSKLRIVIIGGSQGAISFSNIIPKALSLIDNKEIRKNIEIVQQVSSDKMDVLKKKYEKLGVKAKLIDFVNNIAEEMAKSQLVICRSGASTLTELSTIGRPAILIPYPLATENHQYHNAMYYQKRKAAWIIQEGENIEERLSELIINLFSHKELLKEAASNMMDRSVRNSTDVFADFIEKKYS